MTTTDDLIVAAALTGWAYLEGQDHHFWRGGKTISVSTDRMGRINSAKLYTEGIRRNHQQLGKGDKDKLNRIIDWMASDNT